MLRRNPRLHNEQSETGSLGHATCPAKVGVDEEGFGGDGTDVVDKPDAPDKVDADSVGESETADGGDDVQIDDWGASDKTSASWAAVLWLGAA